MSELDLLIEQRGEIDALQQQLDAALANDGERLAVIAQLEQLLRDAAQLLRKLMEIPEVWEASPEIGAMLIRVRGQVGESE